MNTSNTQGNPAFNSSTVFSVAKLYRESAAYRDEIAKVTLELSQDDVEVLLEWAKCYMNYLDIETIHGDAGDLHLVINEALNSLHQESGSING